MESASMIIIILTHFYINVKLWGGKENTRYTSRIYTACQTQLVTITSSITFKQIMSEIIVSNLVAFIGLLQVFEYK